MKRIAWTIGLAALVPVMAWLLGFDFNERGLAAFLTACMTLAAALMTYTCPIWRDD